LTLLCSIAVSESTETTVRNPVYTADGQLTLPEDYREWVYLSSGFDMAYSPMAMGHHMFDNVFVEPGAYKAFLATGTWPDKTMLVLEVRGAMDKGSINQNGNYQSTDVMGREVHVKDSSALTGVGVLRIRYGEDREDDSAISCLLFLSRRSRRGRQHFCAVLSDPLADRNRQRHAVRGLQSRKQHQELTPRPQARQPQSQAA